MKSYLNRSGRSQMFTAVYKKTLIHSWISFLIMLQSNNLKKDSGRDVFLWVCLIFQENLFLKHFFVVIASAKYHFLCCVDLISKMLLSTLVMFRLSLNILRAKTMSRSWTALSVWKSQRIRWFIADKKRSVQNIARSQKQSPRKFL